jgi:anti-sigma B factor antagonist
VTTEGQRFTFEVTHDDGGSVSIALRGELDIGAAPELRELLIELVRREGVAITLDLNGLTFIDSTGIGVIVGAWRRAEAQGGSLSVVNPIPRVGEAIRLVGLDRLMKDES